MHVQARKKTKKRNVQPLDLISREAVKLFVRVMIDAGADGSALRRQVSQECAVARRPKAVKKAKTLKRELMDVPHVLTVWYTERRLRDATGEPRRLRKRGRGVSMRTLLRLANCEYDVDEAVLYLLRTGAIARRGAYYVPAQRTVSLRGAGAATRARNVRVARGVLRTLVHNEDPNAVRWYEFWAENTAVPVGQMRRLSKRTFEAGEQFLSEEDDRMQRAAALKKRGEGLVKRYIGVFQGEETVAPRRRRSSRKGR